MTRNLEKPIDLPAEPRQALLQRFMRIRELSEKLVENLSDADASVQPMPDASPAKWHLAHTTWFFETFVLREHLSGYEPFDARYHFLFNSYYETEGPRLARHARGVLTRPSLDTILAYRRHVTKAMLAQFATWSPHVLDVVDLGCRHEEQHQELLQTDVLCLFDSSPLLPAWWAPDTPAAAAAQAAAECTWIQGFQGAVEIGRGGAGGFDCEGPAHTVWVHPHVLANRLVTTAEWRSFMDAGGYRDPAHWLADGWAWVQQNGIEAPLYWKRGTNGDWSQEFGPCGVVPLMHAAPVRHVSYYEADAFARWSGARLPTEAEWETAAAGLHPCEGSFLDAAGPIAPELARQDPQLQQMFGALWQWTGSAFLPYPGFRASAGALGEYNGKFMSGQFVLRGGSCATPRGHVQATYRNFFYPHQRWQFTGVRLAKDL